MLGEGKWGQEENIWSLITGCDLFSCLLQNFHCFLTMAQAFILLNKRLNRTYLTVGFLYFDKFRG